MNIGFRKFIGVAFAIVACSAGTGVAQARSDVHVGFSIGTRLPHGYVRVNVGHDPYYYYRGTYYHRGPRGYVVVRAPRGAHIRDLPYGYVRVVVGNQVYYRYDDVYYRPWHDEFIVVDPPTEVVHVAPPPSEVSSYLSVWDGDTEYLFKDGQFFRKGPDGLVWKEPPYGAVSKDLPSNAVSVWYKDDEYFTSGGAYFKHVERGFRVVPAPWAEGTPDSSSAPPEAAS
jgi:hypothetical protein